MQHALARAILALLACGVTLQSGCVPSEPERLRVQDRLPALSAAPPSMPRYRPVEHATAELGPDGGTLLLGSAELRISPGALRRTVSIEIQRLANDSLPPLPPGLINVTENEGGYRFLPEDMKFPVDVEVARL